MRPTRQKNHAASHAKVSKRCITNKEKSEPLSTKSTFSSENQRKKNDFSWFFKKVAARKTRSRKAQPALFRLCNALKRFFWTLSLLNWTQLSSPLRAEWRSIFPGKFSSRPHARHSPDQAKRVNAPPLRLFRVRHRDPGGNRRISPPFFHSSLSPTFSSCPPRRRSFHQSAFSWRLRTAQKTKTGPFNKCSTKTPFCGTSFNLLKRKNGFETAWKQTKSLKTHQTGGGRGCGKGGHAGPKRKTPVFKSPQIFAFGFQMRFEAR